jgi:hypothetical protein
LYNARQLYDKFTPACPEFARSVSAPIKHPHFLSDQSDSFKS